MARLDRRWRGHGDPSNGRSFTHQLARASADSGAPRFSGPRCSPPQIVPWAPPILFGTVAGVERVRAAPVAGPARIRRHERRVPRLAASWHQSLVVAQVALSIVLLSAARTLPRVRCSPVAQPGSRVSTAQSVLLMTLDPSPRAVTAGEPDVAVATKGRSTRLKDDGRCRARPRYAAIIADRGPRRSAAPRHRRRRPRSQRRQRRYRLTELGGHRAISECVRTSRR